MTNIEVRDMCNLDLNKVMEIENLCFKAPWKPEDIIVELHENQYSVVLVNNFFTKID